MEQEHMYSVSEAAKALNVSTATIRRMIKDKQLDAVKVRGQLRIRAASLQKYL